MARANGLIDITNSDFPALMKSVYDKSFKSSHAMSGLFPLNREKINDEKLDIGKVFRENNLDEDENEESELSFEMESSKRNSVTPKRQQLSSNDTESIKKSIKKIIETSNKKAAGSITSYLHGNHLNALKNKQKRKLKSAATSSYILTEDKSRAELANKEAEKLRLEEEKKSRKTIRETNKKIKLAAKELANQKRLEKRASRAENQPIKKRTVKVKLLPLLNSTNQLKSTPDLELRDRACHLCDIEFRNG